MIFYLQFNVKDTFSFFLLQNHCTLPFDSLLDGLLEAFLYNNIVWLYSLEWLPPVLEND